MNESYFSARWVPGKGGGASGKTSVFCLPKRDRRSMISPGSSVPFQRVLTRRTLITRVTFQFRVRDQIDIKAMPDRVLSPAHTRQLHTLPMLPDVKVKPIDP